MIPAEAKRPRSGWGFDAHRLNDRPPLLLAGVSVSEEFGIEATSDGDVAAHAVIDSLLGACVLGDIGEHFPDAKGADSMEMLSRVVELCQSCGWAASHLDVTVIAEAVRVGPHRHQIRSNLGDVLGLDEESVSVKATSTDGMGLVGRGEGIAAVSLVTVEPGS